MNKLSLKFCLIFSLALSILCDDVTICSLNLHNFGAERGPVMRSVKTALLAERIKNGNCEILAAQELSAKRTDHARGLCELLTSKLVEITFKGWECIVGDIEEGIQRPAFLYQTKNIELLESYSYKNVEVPKLSKLDKPSYFQRVPLEAIFKIKFKNYSKTIALINIHLKSKSGSRKDETGLKWEIVRMEQAEAVRELAINRLSKRRLPVLILGDRNSDYDSAAAKILTGELRLADFTGKAPCRVAKDLVPICRANILRPPLFVSPVTSDTSNLSVGGTFKFKDKMMFLDDILIDINHLGLAQKRQFSSKEFYSGIEFQPLEASDHALVWVKLVFK